MFRDETLSESRGAADDLTEAAILAGLTEVDDEDDNAVEGAERSDFNLSTLAANVFNSYNNNSSNTDSDIFQCAVSTSFADI